MSATTAAGRVWTVLDLLRWTQGHFAEKGIASARLDAECLLAFALDVDRLRLYVDFEKPVEPAERAKFRELVKRRADDRVPVAQLTGRKEFWSLVFETTPDVLVPRPDTETLVAWYLDQVPDREAELTILDLGTGSGAIAVALATELPKARFTATDVSEAALASRAGTRRATASRTASTSRPATASRRSPGERFDAVLANPPYVAERDADGLAPELRHEPRGALFSGPDGTDLLRRLAADVPEHLAPGGRVAFEIGAGAGGRRHSMALGGGPWRRSPCGAISPASLGSWSEGASHGAG